MKIILTVAILFFSFSMLKAQEQYNNCSSALELCPNEIFEVNNIGANTTVCQSCEDDFNYCFATENTIWFYFSTNNTGGDVQVDFTNLVFEMNPSQGSELQATLINAGFPCDASTYVQIGNCVSNASTSFSLNAMGLLPNENYYLVVNGGLNAGATLPAEASFDLFISGNGVERPIPALALLPQDTVICAGEIITFIADTINCPSNSDFEWYINDTLRAVTTDNFWLTTEVLTGDIVSVNTSCYSLCPVLMEDENHSLTVIDVQVDAGFDIILSEDQESVMLNGSTNGLSINWTPSYSLSDPSILNPIAFPDQTTLYTLTASEGDCVASDQVLVSFSSTVEIPNTFSPNGDGQNDIFRILGIESYTNNQLNIYTRWGQEVFVQRSYKDENAWNGQTKSGEDASPGVYFYVLDLYGNGEELLKGTITLVR